MKQFLKMTSMIPIFLFIGVGILLSLDIIQPSMFRSVENHWYLFLAAIAIGIAPVILITSALATLTELWRRGKKYALLLAFFLCFVFMSSEVVYSYISIESFFQGQPVPPTKVAGIMFLPFTFSLFYFTGIFLEKHPDMSTPPTTSPSLPPQNQELVELEAKYGSLISRREEIINELKTRGLEYLASE